MSPWSMFSWDMPSWPIPTPIGIGWSIGIDWEINGPTKIISMANRASHAPMPCRFRVVATCDSRRLE